MPQEGKHILQELDLSIQENDFVLIFGRNGAGKSTLLKILAGIIPAGCGEVLVMGKNIAQLSKRELATKLSFLPQSDDFCLPLLVKDVLLSGRYPYQSLFRDFSKKDFELYQEAVERFALADLVYRNIQTLSGGERKKVLLATAFIQDVPLILLDEPLNFLDPASAFQMIKMLENFHRKGKTILIVSHLIEYFFPHANKILALKERENTLFRSTNNFRRSYSKISTTFHSSMFFSKTKRSSTPMNKKTWGLAILVFVCFAVSPFWGIVHIDLRTIFQDNSSSFIFWQLRVPRALLGFVAGAILALSGLVCQNLFKNSLATPDLLGISSGAAAGAVLALKFNLSLRFSGNGRPVPIFLSRSSFRGCLHFPDRQSDKKFIRIYIPDVGSGHQFFLFRPDRFLSIYLQLFRHVFIAALAHGRTFRFRLQGNIFFACIAADLSDRHFFL